MAVENKCIPHLPGVVLLTTGKKNSEWKRKVLVLILILFCYFLHDHDTQAAVLTHRKDFWIFVFCIILSWFGAHDDDDHKQHAAWRMEEVA